MSSGDTTRATQRRLIRWGMVFSAAYVVQSLVGRYLAETDPFAAILRGSWGEVMGAVGMLGLARATLFFVAPLGVVREAVVFVWDVRRKP